jgi:hypothetical protein
MGELFRMTGFTAACKRGKLVHEFESIDEVPAQFDGNQAGDERKIKASGGKNCIFALFLPGYLRYCALGV